MRIIYILLFCCIQFAIVQVGIAQSHTNRYQPNSLIVQFKNGMQVNRELLFSEVGAIEKAFYPKLNISHILVDNFPITAYDNVGNLIQLNDILEVQGHIILKPKVDGVSLDYQVSLPPLNDVSSGINAAPLPYCPEVDIYCPLPLSTRRRGIRVGIIDTGADHWLMNKLQQSNNFPSNVHDLDFTSSSYRPIDYHGHGTQMTSIVTNMLATQNISNFTLYPLKALGSDGTGYISNIIAAIEFAICEKLDVLNLSFGYLSNNQDIEGRFLKAVLQKAVDSNILPVVSAGNQGVNLDEVSYYPATLEVSDMLVVGATDCITGDADFSNKGNAVNVKTPGTKILCQTLDENWVLAEGTSHSAAITTGIAIQLAQYQSQFRASQIACALKETSTEVVDVDRAAMLMNFGSCGEMSSPLDSTPEFTLFNATNTALPSYPNPATDMLFIPYDLQEEKQGGKIYIYGQNGKLIRRIPLEGDRKGILPIPVYFLSEGSYFYQIITEENIQNVQQFQILR